MSCMGIRYSLIYIQLHSLRTCFRHAKDNSNRQHRNAKNNINWFSGVDSR